MITKSKTYTISNFSSTKAPYTYTFTVNKTAVTVSPISGTTSTNKITVSLSFPDETYFTGLTVTLTITDKNGCVTSVNISSDFTNPCSSITVSEIVRNGLDFSITSTQASTYTWIYDEDSFTGTTVGTSLSLKLKSTASLIEGNDVTVKCKVLSSTGCEKLKETTFTLEAPNAPLVIVDTLCNDVTPPISDAITLPVTHTYDIDWSTLVVSPLNSVVKYNVVANGIIRLYKDVVSATATHTVYYTVKDVFGIQSNVGVISWRLNCKSLETDVPTGSLGNVNVKDVLVGEKALLPLTVGENVDKSKSTFLEAKGTSQSTGLNGKQLITPSGNAVFNDDGNVEFEIVTPTGIGEPIHVQLESFNGVKGEVLQGFVSFDTINGPYLPYGHEICVLAGQWSPYVSLASGITGDYDPSTWEFVSPPTNGIAHIANGGLVAFLPDEDYWANQVFEFSVRVKNRSGVYSNTQNVYVSVDRYPELSQESVNITCGPSSFNLQSYLSRYSIFASGGTWTEISASGVTYTSQGGTITSPNTTGGVNFSSIITGEYTFRYTISKSALGGAGIQVHNTPATAYVDFTVVKDVTPSITIDSITAIAVGQYKVLFTVYSGTGTAGLTVTVDSLAPTYVTTPSISGTSGEMILSLSSGTKTIALEMITVCSTVVTDSDTVVVP